MFTKGGKSTIPKQILRENLFSSKIIFYHPHQSKKIQYAFLFYYYILTIPVKLKEIFWYCTYSQERSSGKIGRSFGENVNHLDEETDEEPLGWISY